MTFFILAIDHNWQLVPRAGETSEILVAKARLKTSLAEQLTARKIDLICEESDPRHLTIAQKMAFESQPRIAWKNITMTAQERLEAGIWEALLNRPSHTIQEASGYYRTIDHRIPEDDVREHFFKDQSIQEGLSRGSKSVLILCGDMHADSLRQKLQAVQRQAVADNSLIPTKYWQ